VRKHLPVVSDRAIHVVTAKYPAAIARTRQRDRRPHHRFASVKSVISVMSMRDLLDPSPSP
jgi:hypothetical protein